MNTCGSLTLTQTWYLLTIWQTFRWRVLAGVPARTIVPVQALANIVWPDHWTGDRRWPLRTIDLIALADMHLVSFAPAGKQRVGVELTSDGQHLAAWLDHAFQPGSFDILRLEESDLPFISFISQLKLVRAWLSAQQRAPRFLPVPILHAPDDFGASYMELHGLGLIRNFVLDPGRVELSYVATVLALVLYAGCGVGGPSEPESDLPVALAAPGEPTTPGADASPAPACVTVGDGPTGDGPTASSSDCSSGPPGDRGTAAGGLAHPAGCDASTTGLSYAATKLVLHMLAAHEDVDRGLHTNLSQPPFSIDRSALPKRSMFGLDWRKVRPRAIKELLRHGVIYRWAGRTYALTTHGRDVAQHIRADQGGKPKPGPVVWLYNLSTPDLVRLAGEVQAELVRRGS